jgi:hypothetical protein
MNCIRCGRHIRSARSQRTGYGPRCYTRIRRATAALNASGNLAAKKAAELLEDAAIVPIRTHGGRVYRTVSLDGRETHLTSQQACSCKAGLYGKLCYHQVAVTILRAA